MRFGIFVLLIFSASCATNEQVQPDNMTDSERVYEILSTSPEFKDMTILLCIEKDCLTVDSERAHTRKRRLHEP